MENYRNKAGKMIMIHKEPTVQIDPEGNKKLSMKERQTLADEVSDKTLQVVYEAIRDASALETARAIQDSESPTAMD